ncbi:MAG: aminotransferase class I/II-fold pyridoxal phosphate-dependent enzyme [Bradymonadia bacterium]
MPLTDEQIKGLREKAAKIKSRYDAFVARGLALDMTRGKPGPEQLDLAEEMLASVPPGDHTSPGGVDCRNYGGVDGLPELKALFGDYLDCPPDQILVGGNASLTLMHDAVVQALTHGVPGGEGPWLKGPVKWICPVPGYDRHFSICQHFGIEMISVPLGDDGPDMDQVEALVAADPAIKGMWAVPRYSNPTGIVYSDDVICRLAAMKTAAPDFRIWWDNAYAEHHLVDRPKPMASLLNACVAAGNPDRALMFASTSKISFAGGGLAALGASAANIDWMRLHTSKRTIGPDKLNQLRHLRFFGDINGVRDHMKKHAELLRPRFQAVVNVLKSELEGSGLATWTEPEGGYFISVDTLDGCATRIVELAGAAGVKLTPAGATFPHRKDPRDRNIRIAPSLPSVSDLTVATELFALCIQMATLERLS